MKPQTGNLTIPQMAEAATRRGQRIIAAQKGKPVPLLGLSFDEAINEHEQRNNADDQMVISFLLNQKSSGSVSGDAGGFPPAKLLKNPSAKVVSTGDYSSHANERTMSNEREYNFCNIRDE